jgi:hypothetical protein
MEVYLVGLVMLGVLLGAVACVLPVALLFYLMWWHVIPGLVGVVRRRSDPRPVPPVRGPGRS